MLPNLSRCILAVMHYRAGSQDVNSVMGHDASPVVLYCCRRYAGFGVSVVGIVAYRGPYFGVFDTLKELNPWKKDKGIVGLASKFAIAQTTAIIAGFISYPFDTVRRRLQMQAEKPKEQWLYNGTLDCAVKIVKDEGIGAMFKGFAANVLRTLGGALVLVGYDEIKRILG
mmetsp:Transcript_761/g.2060  ORF Transcript_761/g.2060 Transcript_761/m.2060 type:complete len:170 (-) Transcript_761:1198-1707(-)